MFIYCDNPDCNYNCGKFHKPGLMRFPTSVNPTIHEPSISESLPVAVPDNDNVENSHKPLKLNVSAATAAANDPNSSRLSVSHNSAPMSPMSMASTITLDDIIASARRKTEADFQPIVLPSPTYLDDVPKSETYTLSKASRKDSQDSQANIEDLEEDYMPKLIDSDEEEGYWFNDDPPSLIIDDDMADMEELIRATQAPSDHFSNPILRGADPYKKARKKEFDDSSSVGNCAFGDSYYIYDSSLMSVLT
uniref:C3H1-type domain-containing protein n=1 Tax=Panagrellus redivivus TaxID=6233 RepID=A0A7E4ULA5_PANRE